MEQPHISSDTLRHNGWVKHGSDYYFYSPSRGENTHIHLGGSTTHGLCHASFISLKVNDSFAGKIWDKDTIYSNWGALDAIDDVVASEFRRALAAVGVY